MGTPHCLGMCGGFATAAARSIGESVAWHAGKLSTYMVLGALVGGLGGAIPGPGWIGTLLAAILLVWFSLALGGWVPEPTLKIPGLGRLGAATAGRSGIPARFAFGLVNGLLPCGLLYAALGMTVSAGGAVEGALTMGVFGLGTVPGLAAAAWGLRKLLARKPWMRRLLAIGVLLAGLAGLAWREFA